jgi:hypothetical protein
MVDIHEWLDDKIRERCPNALAVLDADTCFEDPAQFVGEALAIKVAALAQGYTEKDLIDACDGDIARFVMRRLAHLDYPIVAVAH